MKWAIFLTTLCFLWSSALWAQPANDNWKNALHIKLGDKGLTDGLYISKKIKLQGASTESGENISQNMTFTGLNNKTVWFVFTTKAHKDIEISLKQHDGSMNVHQAGMTVYSNSAKVPASTSDAGFPAITQFGTIKKSCVAAGTYYVQVCADKNATDSIWLTIKLSSPNVAGNTPQQAIDASKVPSDFFDNPCFSLSGLYELDLYSPRLFNKSAYLYFSTPTVIEKSNLTFTGNRFTAIIYKGTPSDPAQWVKAFELYNPGNTKSLNKTGDCHHKAFEPDADYVIKVLFHDSSHVFTSGPEFVGSVAAKLYNPALKATQLGNISATKTITTISAKDVVDCNSNGASYICSKFTHLISDTIYYNNGQPVLDTMNFGSWLSFTLTQAAQFTYQYSGVPYKNGLVPRLQAFLFTGDYTSGLCQSSPLPISSGYTDCLPAGTYTIFNGLYKNNKTADDIPVLTGRSLNFTIKVVANPGVAGNPALYYNPLLPCKLLNFCYAKPYDKRTTPTDWLNGPLDTHAIDGDTFIGHFSFTTISLAQKAFVKIWPNGGYDESYHLFRGDCSQGLATLKDNVNRLIGHKETEPTYNLVMLDKGTYTLMSDRQPGTACVKPEHHNAQYTVLATTQHDKRPPEPCDAAYYHAKSPGLLNFGKVLHWNSKPTNGFSRFALPITCTDSVNNKGVYNMYNAQKYIHGKTNKVLYYEFELGELSTVQFRINNPIQIIKGSLQADSTLCKNPENVFIEYTSGKNEVCKMPPGKYTVVVVLVSDGIGGYLDVVRFVQASNYYMKRSLDMGILSATNKNLSDSGFMNCVVNAHADPPELWYTFRVVGYGSFQVSQDNAKKSNTSFPNFMTVPEAGGMEFADLKKTNLLDSTWAPGTTYPERSYISYQVYLHASNDTMRYFLKVNPIQNYESQPFAINISFTPETEGTTNGDYCSNAITDTLNGTGKITLKVNASRHTAGEGVYEDSRAWMCNRNVFDTRSYKTTWYKLSLMHNAGNKLSIRPNGVGLVETKMYYGNCDALTPQSCISSNGTVIFDCVGDGDLYFQVITQRTAWGVVSIDFEAIADTATCLGFDMNKPRANFVGSVFCGMEQAKVRNLSTRGSAIDYIWTINHKDTSHRLEPDIMIIPSKNLVDTVAISLKVTNKSNGLSDSTSGYVYVVKESSKILLDTTLCADSLVYTLKPYRPDFYSYSVINRLGQYLVSNGDTFPDFIFEKINDPKIVFYPSYRPKSTYTIYRSALGCGFRDTVYADYLGQHLGNYEGLVCNYLPDTLFIIKPKWAQSITWCDGDTNWTKVFTHRDTCSISVKSKKCTIKQTIHIKEFTRPVYSISDTICVGDAIHFVDLNKQFVLSQINDTNATKYKATASDSVLRTTWKANGGYNCVVRDTNILHNFYSYRSKLHDTVLCNDMPIDINAGNYRLNCLWNQQIAKRVLTISSEGLYRLQASKGACVYYDSFYVSAVYNKIRDIHDTLICDLNTPIQVKMYQPGSYLWSTGDQGNQLNLSDTGQYWVMRQEKWCNAVDTFIIKADCPPQLYVPNAFSPNGDAVNPVFLAKGYQIDSFEMWIFARNGQLVFYSYQLDKGWDGMVNGEPADLGTYFYLIKYRIAGEDKMQSGDLYLIK
ncbi:T9SS type B sorting domain-containing protein [bacterium]|nr:T9SS type B sorting domain-containing protein [bacterium]